MKDPLDTFNEWKTVKLHIVTRTCDRGSIQSNKTAPRIVNKTECSLRCVNSVLKNMADLPNIEIDYHIIDDRSSEYFRDSLKKICEESKQKVTFDFLGDRDTEGQDPHTQSRFSVKVAYDYIYSLPDEDLVYIVDDDYLHRPDAIGRMLTAWDHIDNYLNYVHPKFRLKADLMKEGKKEHEVEDIINRTALRGDNVVGIFPQCFTQLFPFSKNPTLDYYPRPCMVIPTPVGYYQTVWYTHESFMLKAKEFRKYKDVFDRLQVTGTPAAGWEGDTITELWGNHIAMHMPLDPDLMHMSVSQDVPFTWSFDAVQTLWEDNKTPYSLEKNSSIDLKWEELGL